MATVTATEFKRRFGEVIDLARQEPVHIENHGRPTVVIVDAAEFERLQWMEDQYWGERALRAKEGGSLSVEESEAFIREKLAEFESDTTND